MKAIAIVELPDDAFDGGVWGDGKWIIDDEGAIRYEEDNALVHYRDIECGGIELRPLPQEREPNEEWFNEYHRDEFADGWNGCLDEITGKTKWQQYL